MTLSIITRDITDQFGNILEGAQVTIREGHGAGGALAELFSDVAGETAISNPVNVPDGTLLVYAQPGRYRLEGTSSGGSGVSLVDTTPVSPKLENFANLAGGANKLPYFTGSSDISQTDLTAAARTLLARGTIETQSQADTTAGRLIRTQDGYVRGSILGTVSQSGGVPTGAIIQRGSGVNGKFVRYADGTQICWTTIDAGNSAANGDGTFSSPYRSASFTWSFPAAFEGAPVVAGAVSGDDNGIIRTHIFSLRFVTATEIAQARVVRIGSGDANFPVIAHIVAIGRWF